MSNTVGIIIGRFQVDELHEAHHYCIYQVVSNHKNSIIFLGTPKVSGTKSNPLDFQTRKQMIGRTYPSAIIAPLQDCDTDEEWSIELDRRIRGLLNLFPDIRPGEEPVLLYGGRDSFIPHYKGIFKTIEIKEYPSKSGTEARRFIGEHPIDSSDFRKGIIYNTYNQSNKLIPYVKILIDTNLSNDETKEIKKNTLVVLGEPSINDSSLEQSVKRIVSEKIGCEIDMIEYLSSEIYEDWRYKDVKMMIIVYKAKYIFGNLNKAK